MEVILIKDIENLGYANDIVTVKPGYANNYLIPQGTQGCHRIRQEGARREPPPACPHKDAKILADAQALAETIANLPLSLSVKAEEGKLFGTVTATDLAEALAATVGHHRRPQADQRRCHQDRRRVRGYGPSAQGGQGYDQVLGLRCRVTRKKTFVLKRASRCGRLFLLTTPSMRPHSRRIDLPRLHGVGAEHQPHPRKITSAKTTVSAWSLSSPIATEMAIASTGCR